MNQTNRETLRRLFRNLREAHNAAELLDTALEDDEELTAQEDELWSTVERSVALAVEHTGELFNETFK